MGLFSFFFGGKSTPIVGTNNFDALNLANNIKVSGYFNKNNRENSKYLNFIDQDLELWSIKQIYSGRFSWSGKSIEHIPQGFIEANIFNNGYVIAYHDSKLGLVILPASPVEFGYMNTPVSFRLIGTGYSKEVRLPDCVVIKDNDMWWPPIHLALRKSSIIADSGRAIEVYINGMKNPTIINTTDKQKLTKQTLMQAKLDNDPFILVTGRKKEKGDEEEIEQLQFFNTPHNGQDLESLITAKANLKNELLALLGVSINTIHKSQYTNENEQEKQATYIQLLMNQAERNRQDAVERLRKKGFDINVKNNMKEEDEDDDL